MCESDGCDVCTDCGLILQQSLSDIGGHAPLQVHDFKLRSYISNVCERAHIVDGIIDYTLDYTRKLRQQLRERNISSKFSDQEICAFALYDSLNRFETSHTLEEISAVSGNCSKKLFKIESVLSVRTAFVSPLFFVDRYCGYLSMTFEHIKNVRSIIDNNMHLSHIQPQCLVAACVYKCVMTHNLNFSLKFICECCNVSVGNVKKVYKKINYI